MIFAKIVWNINKPWEHHFNEVGYINYIYENVNLFLKYISNMNDWKREYIYIYIYAVSQRVLNKRKKCYC